MMYSHQGKKIEDITKFLQKYFKKDTIDLERSLIVLEDKKLLRESLEQQFDIKDIKKRFELSSKKDSLKEQIEEYKITRSKLKQKTEKLEELAIKKESLLSLFNSVSSLIEKSDFIDKELEKFGELKERGDITEKAESIKYRRTQLVMQALQTLKKYVVPNKADSIKNTSKNSRNFYPLFLLLLIIQAVGSVSALTFTNSILILSSVSIFFLINATLYFLLIVIRSNEAAKFAVDLSEERLGYDSIINEFDETEDMFLVNTAWVNALKRERDILKGIINEQLKDDQETVSSLKAKIESIKKSELEWENIGKDTTLSPQEYLKLRREFDILEIESEEFSAAAEKGLPPLIIAGINKISADKAEAVYNEIQTLVNLGILKQYVLLETE